MLNKKNTVPLRPFYRTAVKQVAFVVIFQTTAAACTQIVDIENQSYKAKAQEVRNNNSVELKLI